MTKVAETRNELVQLRSDMVAEVGSGPIAVVMTMGALHAGHVELIRQARSRARAVMVTDFLNPLQFAAGEDLSKYPRTFDNDLTLCRQEGVDLLFAPTPEVVYPDGEPVVRVSSGPVGNLLEGDSRPGHFDGVVTVVAKMLHLTGAQLAYFGQKDAQQLWLIKQMVGDLDFSVDVIAVPTVRAPDGLALSSRNTYLSDVDRSCALTLYRALVSGADASPLGVEGVLRAATAVLESEPGVRLDYLELVDPETFEVVKPGYRGQALLLVAAFVGTTRLIDNVIIRIPATPDGA